MDDDFNTPKALASIFNLINQGNSLLSQNRLSPADAREILNFLREVDKVFGFIFEKKELKIPSLIKKMIKTRERARKKGDFKLADLIREKIKEKGYWIEDTKEGPKVKKIS
jgi:cysteinyl-tRNA synthetase